MPASAISNRPEDLIANLSSGDTSAKLKALRDVKNQIIGNKTKKLSYIKLGAVPRVVEILANSSSDASLLVQSAATVGSFACGVDAGVQAVLDSGVLPHLIRIITNSDEKVVETGARSLRMIFQSKLAPKYDILQEKNRDFILYLLNSDNESLTELAASIITHSCETSEEQKALCDAGVLERLFNLLNGSLNQKDASLDSLAAIVKSNYNVVSRLLGLDGGKALSAVISLTKDRSSRTRLLACLCLIAVGDASPIYLHELEMKKKLILILVELVEEPCQAGVEAPHALADLVAGREDMQKLAFDVHAVEKLCNSLRKGPVEAKRLQGILLALSELCSKLEGCRSRFLSMEVLQFVADALKHDFAEVRAAACTCIRSISRSVKNLSAGRFTNETIVTSLLWLLHDASTSVQVAALGAIINIVVDFTTCKSVFIQCGGVKLLVQLSKSMDSVLRLNAVWALKNLMFLADSKAKKKIVKELSISTLTSLICDPESSIQEQALALVRNLVDGCIDSVEHVFAEDGIIMNAVVRQVRNASKSEVCVQGMFVLSNVATGTEFHKDFVMHHLLSSSSEICASSVLIRFFQDNDNQLRTASIWCIVNLTHPGSIGAASRVEKLQNAGIISQIKNMVNDPCLDVKYRVQTALEQCITSESCSM